MDITLEKLCRARDRVFYLQSTSVCRYSSQFVRPDLVTWLRTALIVGLQLPLFHLPGPNVLLGCTNGMVTMTGLETWIGSLCLTLNTSHN